MTKQPNRIPDKQESRDFVLQLIEREYKELYKFLLFKLNNDVDEALECISQIYDIALKKATIVHSHANPNGWLYKTAQLCARHRLSRRRSKPPEVPLDSVINTLSYEQNFDDEPDEKGLEAAKKRCLAVLSELELVTYEMFYMEKLTIKEIAKKTGSSEAAIGTRLYRIRIKLTNEVNKLF